MHRTRSTFECDAKRLVRDHIRRLRPTETPARLRARLGGFGIGAEQAETLVGKLSGGQKARLSLMLATIDAPHLLILDEPTNHLDIESREALVEALTAYTGAVILVSHDMHLLSLVADRLWLVKDGAVKPYEGDLESYRALLLGAPEKKSDKKTETQKAPKPKRAPRLSVLELRAEVRTCEERVEKLERMRARMDEMLADPTLYSERKHAVPELQRKDGELKVALKRAEALWEGAIAKLEAAEA